MKITIEPEEGESFETISWENIYQVSLSATHMANKMVYGRIMHNQISDKAELIGLLYEQIERIRNYDGSQ